MTRPLRLSDLSHIASELVRLGTAMSAPCTTCDPARPHTIGEHVHRALRDAAPGARASSLEPNRSSGHSDGLAGALTTDREGEALDEFTATAWQLYSAVGVLGRIVENWSPERRDKLKDSTSPDDMWCGWHLQMIGTREPRYAGDQCRWCYDFRRQNDMMPPRELLEARHSGRRVTSAMVADIKRLQKAKRQKRRRKARK